MDNKLSEWKSLVFSCPEDSDLENATQKAAAL